MDRPEHAWDGADHVRRLREDGTRLLVFRDEEIVFRSEDRGIRPVLVALESVPPETLRGATFVDRVIGRAAALLVAHAGAGAVAAIVVSVTAMEVLKWHAIPVYREESTSRISGREPGKPCPFEQAVAEIEDPAVAHERLRALAVEMGLLP